MSTETKHTPLPWTIHPLSKRKVCAGPDGGKQTIAACGRAGEVPPSIYDELCANAAFIIRACNAHYDLITTAEAALNAIDTLMGRLAKDAPQFLPPPADIAGEPWASILKGRVALAKAKGRKPIRLEGRFIGSDPMMNND